MRHRAPFLRLTGDERGAMAVETALVAPVLILLALGTYDVSNLVSRQQDLQSAASEATQVVLAAANGSGVNSTELETILEASLSLDEDQLEIKQRFRCDAAADLIEASETCDPTKPIYQYVRLDLKNYSYTPLWTNFGVGDTVNYNVVRTVQVGVVPAT